MAIMMHQWEMAVMLDERDQLKEDNRILRERVKQLEDEYERIWFELRDELAKSQPSNRKKLTPGEVKEIRRFGRTSGLTNRELADMYSVHRSTIARIKDGTYHKDVY